MGFIGGITHLLTSWDIQVGDMWSIPRGVLRISLIFKIQPSHDKNLMGPWNFSIYLPTNLPLRNTCILHLYTYIYHIFTYIYHIFTYISHIFTYIYHIFTYIYHIFTYIYHIFTYIYHIFTYIYHIFTYIYHIFTYTFTIYLPTGTIANIPDSFYGSPYGSGVIWQHLRPGDPLKATPRDPEEDSSWWNMNAPKHTYTHTYDKFSKVVVDFSRRHARNSSFGRNREKDFRKTVIWMFPKIGGFYPQNGWWK